MNIASGAENGSVFSVWRSWFFQMCWLPQEVQLQQKQPMTQVACETCINVLMKTNVCENGTCCAAQTGNQVAACAAFSGAAVLSQCDFQLDLSLFYFMNFQHSHAKSSATDKLN